MIRSLLAILGLSVMLAVTGCATDQSKGPTYPVVGTVDQTQLEQKADQARIAFAALSTATAQYVALPRCGQPTSPPLCSSQSLVNEVRPYANAADYATAEAQKLARSPTKSPVALANAVNDASRAVELFRGTVAKFNAKAAKEA